MANGFFLGGMAKGIESSRASRRADRQVELQDRALGLKEDIVKSEAKRKKIEAVDTEIANTMKIVSETIKAGLEAGRSPEEIRKAIGPLVKDVAELTELTGRDPSRVLSSIDVLLTSPGAVESASGTGTANAARRVAEANALAGAGVPASQAQATAGISQADPQKPMTDAGKLVADREMFVRQYGEGSAQVKAFDEASKGGKAPDLSDVGGMRKEFTSQSKDFVQVRDAFGRIAAAVQNPSAAGDLAMIFNYMKMLDPGSTVREGEFATAQNTAGLPQRVVNIYNRLLSGERLAPEQREDFAARAEELFGVQLRSQVALENQYRSLAERNKMNPNDVVIDLVGEYRSALPGGADKGGKPNVIRYDLKGNRIQ